MNLCNMKKNCKIYAWIILTVVCFIIYALSTQLFSSEEAKIKKFIQKGERAVESKALFTCSGMISEAYKDKYGNNRQSLIYIAKKVFDYYKDISVDIKDIHIELDDTHKNAAVKIIAAVSGQGPRNRDEKILEGREGVTIKIAKENNKWRLLEIEIFEPVTLMGEKISLDEIPSL